MDRLWLIAVLAGFGCFAAHAQPGSIPHARAGGVDVALPAPAADFVEVGEKLRTTFFDLLAPSTNRLLTAYLPAHVMSDLPRAAASGLDLYAMVQVARRAEYVDCTPGAFQEVLNGIGAAKANLDTPQLAAMQDEMKARLKSLGAKPIEAGRPEILGHLFQEPDANGIAMLMTAKEAERQVTMAAGLAVLRVKQRLMFAYLYRKYESPDTIEWLGKALNAWTDSIQRANR